MTPAIDLVRQTKISYNVHQYQHQSNAASFGEEAVHMLNVNAKQVFKTLVVLLDKQTLAVAILPVTHQLSLKLVAKALGGKKAKMADKELVQRSTGYVLGGVSPLGQKKQLTTVIDNSANNFNCIYVSAGRRGLEIELAAQDLKKLTHAKFAPLCGDSAL